MLKRTGFFDRQVERQHTVDAGGRGPRRKFGRSHAQQRVRVAEHDDRRRHATADLLDHAERGAQAAAGGQCALGCALNHGSIGERIGKRHADLEHVGARAIECAQKLRGARQIGIAGRCIRDKPRTGLRFLALTGFVNLAFLVIYSLPMAITGLYADSYPKDVTSRSYFLNGLCGPGTPYACPGPKVPVARRGSVRLGLDGSMVGPSTTER